MSEEKKSRIQRRNRWIMYVGTTLWIAWNVQLVVLCSLSSVAVSHPADPWLQASLIVGYVLGAVLLVTLGQRVFSCCRLSLVVVGLAFGCAVAGTFYYALQALAGCMSPWLLGVLGVLTLVLTILWMCIVCVRSSGSLYGAMGATTAVGVLVAAGLHGLEGTVLGAALGAMVANLSAHKAGWDEHWEEFSDWADRGQALLSELLHLVDEDTAAFNRIMDVFAMPKSTDEEKAARSEALQAATLYATQVPLRTMKAAVQVFDLVQAMAAEGNPNSVSDAGVGALAARSAVLGACLNVKINAAGLKDRAAADALVAEAEALAAEADRREREVLAVVESKIQ